MTEILDVDLIRLKSPPLFWKMNLSSSSDERGESTYWASWKEVVSVLTCSECYIHENIDVFSARKGSHFWVQYENFAFFSVIWLGNIMYSAFSFLIIHTLLFLIEMISVMFIVSHCNSDYAHNRICLSFLSSYVFWLIHQASLHICAVSKYLLCFLVAFGKYDKYWVLWIYDTVSL